MDIENMTVKEVNKIIDEIVMAMVQRGAILLAIKYDLQLGPAKCNGWMPVIHQEVDRTQLVIDVWRNEFPENIWERICQRAVADWQTMRPAISDETREFIAAHVRRHTEARTNQQDHFSPLPFLKS